MAISKKGIDIFIKAKNILEENNLLTLEELKIYEQEINRLNKQRKQALKRQNDRNKNDEKYHTITNRIWYYKKIGNLEKEEYWRNELKKHKKSKEEQL